MYILVADSNRSSREQAAKWLLERKHRVDVAKDPFALFELLAGNAPDAVLLEADFGHLPLRDLIRRIRGFHKAATYIVALLGQLPPGIQALFEMGANDFVRKGCSREELVARAETPLRARTASDTKNTLPELAVDWSPAKGAMPLRDWRDAGALVSESIGEMLGVQLERVTLPRPISQPAFAATVSLTSTRESAGVDMALVVGSSAVREFTRILVGDADLSRETLEDFVREMANTAMAALKRAAHAEGVALTTGLPVVASLAALDRFSGEGASTFSYRLVDTDHCFTLLLAQHARVVEWVSAACLCDGMILFKDLHNEIGNLLLSAGTRITSTSAERIARMVGPKLVEICVAA
jgi:CheY-like chemotaxis protein